MEQQERSLLFKFLIFLGFLFPISLVLLVLSSLYGVFSLSIGSLFFVIVSILISVIYTLCFMISGFVNSDTLKDLVFNPVVVILFLIALIYLNYICLKVSLQFVDIKSIILKINVVYNVLFVVVIKFCNR